MALASINPGAIHAKPATPHFGNDIASARPAATASPHRAGSAAFFDWVLVNAILPSTDSNTNHVGIQKIDRTTVLEPSEIISGYDSVQAQVDKADAGLNPLGLAKNVVPFDIDPSQIASGKTHFEQIYERALESMNNTVTVFNHANQLSQSLRALQDSVNDFSRNAEHQERDFKNRLIEILAILTQATSVPAKHIRRATMVPTSITTSMPTRWN